MSFQRDVKVGVVMGRTRGAQSARMRSGTLSSLGVESTAELWLGKTTLGLVVTRWVSNARDKGGMDGTAHNEGLGRDPLYKPVARISVMTTTGRR